jgi:adenylate cyclase class 2
MNTKASLGSEHFEIEVKLEISDLRKIRQQLKKLGFHERQHRKFEDNWILDFAKTPLFKAHSLLRLREFDGKFLVTFKAPPSKSAHFKIREELETEVADGGAFREILKRLKLRPSFRYQKYRSVFAEKKPDKSKKIAVSVDETPIGNYLEIEGPKEAIREIAAHLGYSQRDFITQSYWELYARKAVRSRRREMIFEK